MGKRIRFLFFAVCIGGVIGAFIWFFLRIMSIGQELLFTFKKEGKYPCDHLAIRTIAALLPLIFGASLGPEAGLTGIIAGLCFWAGSKFRYAVKHMEELSNIGQGASLDVIFRSPLFGYSYSTEEKDTSAEFSKTVKMVTYIAAGMIYTFFHAANSRLFDALKAKCGVIVCAVLGGIWLQSQNVHSCFRGGSITRIKGRQRRIHFG